MEQSIEWCSWLLLDGHLTLQRASLFLPKKSQLKVERVRHAATRPRIHLPIHDFSDFSDHHHQWHHRVYMTSMAWCRKKPLASCCRLRDPKCSKESKVGTHELASWTNLVTTAYSFEVRQNSPQNSRLGRPAFAPLELARKYHCHNQFLTAAHHKEVAVTINMT